MFGLLVAFESLKLWKGCGGARLPVQGGLRLEQHVGDVLLDLGDVVEGVLRLAVQPRARREADDAGEQTERGAVHGLRDALREQRGLLRRIDAGDARERLDETGDGAE